MHKNIMWECWGIGFSFTEATEIFGLTISEERFNREMKVRDYILERDMAKDKKINAPLVQLDRATAF